MAIAHKTGFFEVETPGFGIKVCLVGKDVYNLGNKHIMATERNNALDPAFDRNRRFFDCRTFDSHAWIAVQT